MNVSERLYTYSTLITTYGNIWKFGDDEKENKKTDGP